MASVDIAQGGPSPPAASKAQAWLIGILCFAIMVVDGYDIGAMPIIVVHLAERWQADPASFGPAPPSSSSPAIPGTMSWSEA